MNTEYFGLSILYVVKQENVRFVYFFLHFFKNASPVSSKIWFKE